MGLTRNKVFLCFTFALTWVSWWLLSYLTQAGIIEYQSAFGQILLIIGGSGPTVGAYVAITSTKKDGSLKEFHSRVLKFKVNPNFYIFALTTPLILGLLGLGIAYSINSQYFINNPIQPIFLFVPALVVSVFMGGIEEFGWRGVLQPSLTRRFNLLVTNLIIGITWSLWHLPLFYVTGNNHQGNSLFFFTLSGIGYSSFLTWLYTKTNSIFLCVLFHASINATASTGLMINMGRNTYYYYYSVFIFIAGLLLLLSLDRKNKVSELD